MLDHHFRYQPRLLMDFIIHISMLDYDQVSAMCQRGAVHVTSTHNLMTSLAKYAQHHHWVWVGQAVPDTDRCPSSEYLACLVKL
jgi:hypothetical protein